MGSVPTITIERGPAQTDWVGRRVDVTFHHGHGVIGGVIVRDDAEAPKRTVIELDDGRLVLSTECQFTPVPTGLSSGGVPASLGPAATSRMTDRPRIEAPATGTTHEQISAIRSAIAPFLNRYGCSEVGDLARDVGHIIENRQ